MWSITKVSSLGPSTHLKWQRIGEATRRLRPALKPSKRFTIAPLPRGGGGGYHIQLTRVLVVRFRDYKCGFGTTYSGVTML